MTAAYETLVQLLDERDVPYLSSDEEQSVMTDLRGEVALYRVLAHVAPESDLFQVYGCFSVRIPVGSRSDIAEVVARANYGLRVGKFELDVDDGELRFQASQILTEEGLDADVIDRLIRTTLTMLDTYVPAVLSVVYGNDLPKDAVRHVEGVPFDGTDAGNDEDEATRSGQTEEDDEGGASYTAQGEADDEAEYAAPSGIDSDGRERIASQLFERIEENGWTCTHCGHEGTAHEDFRLSIGPACCVICRKCGWPQEEDAKGQ